MWKYFFLPNICNYVCGNIDKSVFNFHHQCMRWDFLTLLQDNVCNVNVLATEMIFSFLYKKFKAKFNIKNSFLFYSSTHYI